MSKIEKHADGKDYSRLYLAGIFLWIVLLIAYHQYTASRAIPFDEWQAITIYGSAVIVVMWPYWRMWPFWWLVNIGILLLAGFLIGNMDAAARKAAQWPDFVLTYGGAFTCIWPFFFFRR